ncbi:MAG: hypothetical protein LBK55_09300 [Azoarcus sp.]|jgi:hypothetical protein|nr:hypothetical protein [Azoarcus sp.]
MYNLEKAAGAKPAQSKDQVLSKLEELYREAFAHDGYAEIRVELRILRRGQKEVILHCGKQYRFVVDYPLPAAEKRAGGGGGQKRFPAGSDPANEETGWRRGVAAQPAGEEPDMS